MFIPHSLGRAVSKPSILEQLELRVLLTALPTTILPQGNDRLANGVLLINGDAVGDRIEVSRRQVVYRVYHNGLLRTYSASAVQRIEIRTDGGDDVIDASGVKIPVYVDAGSGNDSVSTGSGDDTIVGGQGKDTIRGGNGNDWLKGGGTNDQLFGEGGGDTLYGGDGKDWLDGGGDVDRLLGDTGNDTLAGSGSADKLGGGEGSDRLLGNMTLGTMSGEIRKEDGRIDVDATIASLAKLGINTYYYLIWHNEHDWEDMPEFVDKAAKIGITVWVYVIPWTETPIKKKDSWGYSEPFRMDYKQWAIETAQMMNEHKNVAGLIIDDFYINTLANSFWDDVMHMERFSPQYIKDMVDGAKAINPKFQFQPLMYFQTPWQDFLDQYASSIDGVVLAYPKSSEGIDNAMTYLRDQRHGPSVMLLLDRNRPAMADQAGTIETQMNITDPSEARVTFYYDNTNQVGGNTGEEIMRATIDGNVVWEQRMDTNAPDQMVRIDLSKFILEPGNYDLELGMYCIKKGIPKTMPVEGRFDDIRVYGTGDTPAQFSTALNWNVRQDGEFVTTLTPAREGTGSLHLPITLMPAGVDWQYRRRYGEHASVKKLGRKISLSMAMLQQGVVQGVVPWCSPLDQSNEYYQDLKKLLAEAPAVSLLNGTLQINSNDGPDTISITTRGPNIRVRTNGTLRTFPLCNVQQVQIYSAAGDDRIDFSGVNLPVHVHAGDGDDAIMPGDGKDILDGQGGNDTVIGQSQSDETDDKHSHASSITGILDTDISIENVIA